MNKDFAPHTEALELKELGFNEPCFATYSNVQEAGIEKGSLSYYKGLFLPISSKMFCLAPTFSQAFRWFREKYGLFIQPNITRDKNGDWYYFYITGGKKRTEVTEGSFKYEEAELECLKKLIEIVKKK